jgi:hypothetical protein
LGGLDRLQRSDGRTGWDLEIGRVDVDRRGRGLEHARRPQSEDREDDRAYDESGHDEPIRESAGAAPPLLLLTLPLTLLFLAPIAAQFCGHT